jgi:hypothetical protein
MKEEKFTLGSSLHMSGILPRTSDKLIAPEDETQARYDPVTII